MWSIISSLSYWTFLSFTQCVGLCAGKEDAWLFVSTVLTSPRGRNDAGQTGWHSHTHSPFHWPQRSCPSPSLLCPLMDDLSHSYSPSGVIFWQTGTDPDTDHCTWFGELTFLQRYQTLIHLCLQCEPKLIFGCLFRPGVYIPKLSYPLATGEKSILLIWNDNS